VSRACSRRRIEIHHIVLAPNEVTEQRGIPVTTPGETITKSELEDRFLAFLDAHALPRPRINEEVGPYTVDALWQEEVGALRVAHAPQCRRRAVA
jgi:hypothetical protein